MYSPLYSILLASYLGHHGAAATRQTALSNKHFKMAAMPWPPFLVIDKGTYSGSLWDFVEYLKEARNLTLTVLQPRDGQWGNCFGGNNCSGMLGMVARKEVDFALGISGAVQ